MARRMAQHRSNSSATTRSGSPSRCRRTTCSTPSSTRRHDLAATRQDPRLPQGQGAAAGARAARRQGAPLRRGGREPHRRLVLERRHAHARAPGRAARVRLRAADERRRGLEFTATVAVQPKPELPDWTTLEVPRREAEVPEELVARGARGAAAHRRRARPGRRPPRAARATPSSSTSSRRGRRRPARLRRRARLASGSSRRSRTAIVGPARGETTRDRDTSSETARRRGVAVTVKEIKERVLPPLDDELARAASRVRHARRAARRHRGAICASRSTTSSRAQFRAAAVDELVQRVEGRRPRARSSRCARASC